MSDIEWRDDAVCYTNWNQWGVDRFNFEDMLCKHLVDLEDFQLNEIRKNDYIPKSELNTDQKYNDAVEVIQLFGFECRGRCGFLGLEGTAIKGLAVNSRGVILNSIDNGPCKRKITYPQLMAIGKLKRMMLEREKSKLIENASMMKQLRNSELDAPVKFTLNYQVNPFTKYGAAKFNPDTMQQIKDDGSGVAKPKRRNKAKQAYDILKSLDYEYDLVKQKWFKKEYI